MADRPTDNALGILSRSRVFQGVPSADLERLAARCACERYRKGAVISRRGNPGEALTVLGRGRVKATLPSPGAEGEFLVAMFWPGDVFGEAAVFENLARPATGIAITEVEVAFVPRAELLTLIERRPAVSLRLIEALCEKLRTALDLSLSMRFLDVPSRFYQRLLYLARFDSRRDGDGVRIHHGLSQHELADSIGASREALNKVIAEWKRSGLLEWGRGYVVVRDPSLLAQRIPPEVRSETILGIATHLDAVAARPFADGPKVR